MNPAPSSESRPVALVTGGTSGIGAATSQMLIKRGFFVVVCGRDAKRNGKAADTFGQRGQVVSCDLNDVSQVNKLFEHAQAQGQIEILVNNAAFAPLGNFGEWTAETFERTINTNIRSVFYLTQKVWREMLGAGQGTIFNISSLAAVDPFPGFSLYGASKSWLDLLTHALASEGEEAGIRVYSIRPGAVETPMLRGLFPEFPADQCVAPEDIAHQIEEILQRPNAFRSGTAYAVTNQESPS